MPRLPIDYSKIIIYKICCNDVNIKEVYVGHTTDITRRKQHHKTSCNNEKNKEYNEYKYQFIRQNGGWDNWSLVPVEEYPCSNINQACIRERYWIETLQAELNKQIPSRSKKEYCKINKDKICEKSKEYYENNKTKIIQYKKEWYKNNKEKEKERHKEYYENNKEKINEKVKQYRDENKDKIKEKNKEKFTCECGSVCRIGDKSAHFKSKKHQDYLTRINEDRQESTS